MSETTVVETCHGIEKWVVSSLLNTGTVKIVEINRNQERIRPQAAVVQQVAASSPNFTNKKLDEPCHAAPVPPRHTISDWSGKIELRQVVHAGQRRVFASSGPMRCMQ
jgi:hypothetical protein